MTEQLTPPSAPSQRSPSRIVAWFLLALLTVIVMVILCLGVLANSDKGSRWLLEFVMNRQQMIHYQYTKGNLVDGLQLADIAVKVKDVEVKVDRAKVRLGWRAIINKELHFTDADIGTVQVINHAPSKDEPFKFSRINLPFVLRLDDAQVEKLQIQTTSARVNFYHIDLNDALWSGTRISLVDSSMSMDYLNTQHVTGFIQLDQKYPIQVKGILNIPALKTLNMQHIHVAAYGSLDTLKAGVAAATPDIVSGHVVLHPVAKKVPMQGVVHWKKFHWPLVTTQKLYSDQGQIDVSGNIDLLNFVVNSDLSGENIPQGQYQAKLNTDLKQLTIEDLVGSVMQGKVQLSGNLGWQKGVSWNVAGKMQGINPHDKLIPASIQDFLPDDMSGKFASSGSIDKATDIVASMDFDKYEDWTVHLQQAESKNTQPQPWSIRASWQDINRSMPYFGWLTSAKGDVDVLLVQDKGQTIKVESLVESHQQSMLPAGKYSARLNLANNILSLLDFNLHNGSSNLKANAVVHLPTEKTQLKWQAMLQAEQFNPQTMVASAPFNLVNGAIQASGYAETNKQVIQLKHIQLTGQVAQANQVQHVTLNGASTAVFLLHQAPQQTGLKSFAVQYDGQLNADKYSQGPLQVNIAGTPRSLKINRLYHQGAAGQIDAQGVISLVQGVAWDLQAKLQHFKPHYFISGIKGELSGSIDSNGQWSDAQKNITVRNLDLRGQINDKQLLGKGSLSASFNNAQNFVPRQFEANHLVLSYANNALLVSGNAHRLQLNISAPQLNTLYPALSGAIKGFISIQGQPSLMARSNLQITDFAYGQLLNIGKASLVGTLPTGSQASRMHLTIDNAFSGEHQLEHASVELLGTRQAHILRLQGQNAISKFYAQLAGGLTDQNDWLGQIQQGQFDSEKVLLKQSHNAAVIFRKAQTQLSIADHCWINQQRQQSQICLEKPLLASKTQGAVALTAKNIELADFQSFMPAGLSLNGVLNGFTHLSWLPNQAMQMQAELVTQKGVIGLSSVESNSQLTKLDYDQLKLSASTLAEGIAVRMTAVTPLLGKAFVNVLVGTQGEDKPISGDVSLDQINLSILRPFISDIRTLEGQLSIAGKLQGTLKQPGFDGAARLKNGRLALISVPLSLSNIQIASTISGHQAIVKGAFNSGQGVGQINGIADWAAAPKIHFNIAGKDLLFAQPPLVSAAVSPNINIDILPAIQHLTVTGKVDIPRAVISMPESSANVVANSADVRVVDRSKDQLEILNAAKPWHIRADMDINLGKNIIFRGFNSSIPLTGRLLLTQRGTEIAMQADGAIGVSRQVKIDAYGQSLTLNRAIARFNGELVNPVLDIEASKDVQNSLIGVRVTGSASRPNIQIYNDAGLSEQEALNALLTGQISSGSSSGVNNTEGFKSDVNNTIAAAGISMGLGGTRALTNQIGRTFGLSGLALDAEGSGDDTQVNVTGYITPDLYLRYGVGIFTPVTKLTLRYQVNRRLYMEASSSVERAVDMFYHWKF